MGWGIQVHSITAAPAAAAPKLKRVLGLWDLVYYGVILTSPIAVVPMFGEAQVLSQGHAVLTLLAAFIRRRGLFIPMSAGRLILRSVLFWGGPCFWNTSSSPCKTVYTLR
jgi:hypothetical protein